MVQSGQGTHLLLSLTEAVSVSIIELHLPQISFHLRNSQFLHGVDSLFHTESLPVVMSKEEDLLCVLCLGSVPGATYPNLPLVSLEMHNMQCTLGASVSTAKTNPTAPAISPALLNREFQILIVPINIL